MKLFSLIASACSLVATAISASEQPNIIFILCDDLGYGDVGVFFQNQRAQAARADKPWHFTPQLDKMAAEGVTMPHHYAAAPVCAPSRASLLAGVHQGHANVRNNQFDKALEANHTIAGVLKKLGYATYAAGKWGLQGHGGYDSSQRNGYAAHPLNRGFDQYFGYITHKDGHRHYPKEDKAHLLENAKDVTADFDTCYTTDLFTARTKQWIIDHQKEQPEQPFFIYLAYDTPHAILQVPSVAYPEGGGVNGGLQWLGKSGKMINTAVGTPDSWIHPDYMNARWKNDQLWPDIYQRYATMVRRIDDGVGDIIQLLKDLNIDENTMVVFTSDNGPSKESYMKESYKPNFFESFGPFDGIKRDLLEGGIRVGALARWPAKIAPKQVCDTPSAFWDWMPTFTEMAGAPAPIRSDGVSLLPALSGVGNQMPSKLYFEYLSETKTPGYPEFLNKHRNGKRNEMQAIRIGDYIGVRYNIKSHQDPFQIYNVVKDPQQSTNLAMELSELQKQMKDTTLRMRRPASHAKRPYDKELVPSVDLKNLKPGLKWADYSITTPWLANTDSLTPSAEGQIDRPSDKLNTLGKATQRQISGYLYAPKDGEYQFMLNSSGKALLRLHHITVIDADANYSSGNTKSTKIQLQAGMHPFTCYIKSGQKSTLSLEWSGPDIKTTPIPASAFYQKP